MAPTSVQTVIKPPCSISRAISIVLCCCRLPTAGVLSNKAHNSRSDQFRLTSPSFLRLQLQYHTSCRNKGNCNTVKYRGPWWWMPWAGEAGARANISRLKAYASLNNARGILPVCRSLYEFSTLLARRRSSFPPPSPNLVLTHPIARATACLRVLVRPARLSSTVPPASRVPRPLEGHQTGARKRRTW